MVSTQFEEERKEKKERKKKNNFRPNHNTHVTQRGRRHRDESNDTVESWLKSSEPAAHITKRRGVVDACETHINNFFIFLCKNQKCP
jgi:hypothetical protein